MHVKDGDNLFLTALLKHSLLPGGRKELSKLFTFEFQNIHEGQDLRGYCPSGRVTPNAIPRILESLKM